MHAKNLRSAILRQPEAYSVDEIAQGPLSLFLTGGDVSNVDARQSRPTGFQDGASRQGSGEERGTCAHRFAGGCSFSANLATASRRRRFEDPGYAHVPTQAFATSCPPMQSTLATTPPMTVP